MSALYDQLEQQARLLSADERAKLAHVLIEELDASNRGDIEALWIAESQRRYKAFLEGDIGSRPGDEVMAEARSRIK